MARRQPTKKQTYAQMTHVVCSPLPKKTTTRAKRHPGKSRERTVTIFSVGKKNNNSKGTNTVRIVTHSTTIPCESLSLSDEKTPPPHAKKKGRRERAPQTTEGELRFPRWGNDGERRTKGGGGEVSDSHPSAMRCSCPTNPPAAAQNDARTPKTMHSPIIAPPIKCLFRGQSTMASAPEKRGRPAPRGEFELFPVRMGVGEERRDSFLRPRRRISMLRSLVPMENILLLLVHFWLEPR